MVHSPNVEGDEPNELLCLNFLNFFLFLGQAFCTVCLGQFGLFGFTTTQQISYLYPTLITPSPWVLSTVTFILFVAQLIWAVAQLFRDFRPKARDGVKHYYVGVALCQVVWVLMFSYQLVLISLFVATVIACFLGFLLHDLNTYVSLNGMLDYWVLKAPFSVNFGWILYVILWNLSVVLVDYKVSVNAQYWVALISLVAMGMASFSILFRTMAEYAIPSVMVYVTVRTYESECNCIYRCHCLTYQHVYAHCDLLDWNIGRVERSRWPAYNMVWRQSNRRSPNHFHPHFCSGHGCNGCSCPTSNILCLKVSAKGT